MKASLLQTRVLTLPPYAVTFPAFEPAAPVPPPLPPVPQPEPPVVLPVRPRGYRGSHRQPHPVWAFLTLGVGLGLIAGAGSVLAAARLVLS